MSEYDWTAFEALRKSIADGPVRCGHTDRWRAQRARVLERMARARTAIESGQAFRMRQMNRVVWVHTPAHFMDAWEAGYR